MDIAIKEYFGLLFPLLLVACTLSGVVRFMRKLGLMRQIGKPAVIMLSVLITLYPFTELSLAEFLLSLNPNYSIGSLAFFFIILWNQFGWKPLFSHKNLLQFCIWNVVVSLCLFASYLGFVNFDLYAMGYRFSVWFVITGLLTIFLLLIRNPLSYIFIAYITVFDLRLLPSDNFFDYITDGVLFLISLGIVTFYAVKFTVSKVSKDMQKLFLRGVDNL